MEDARTNMESAREKANIIAEELGIERWMGMQGWDRMWEEKWMWRWDHKW
jgi:hypothetical protein